jgi:hypothetical protein
MPLILISNNGGGGGPPPVDRLTFVNSYFSNANDETFHDFTSVSFGADTADRQILVAVMTVGDTAGTISCEIGDDTTPELDAQSGTGSLNRTVHIFRGRPTGTSGTIRVATTGTFDDVLISVYRAIDDIIPFQVQKLGSNGMTTYNFQLEIPDDGAVLAAAINAGTSDAGLHTWSGLTEDAERGGSTDFRSTSFIAAGSAAHLSGHVGQSFESISLALSQTGAFQTALCAVAYGIAGDVPTVNWTTMYTASTPSEESNTNVVNDTIRSRFRGDNFVATPPSDLTHVRITMMAAGTEGWACSKSYIGNGVLATTTDAMDLAQLLFGGVAAFSVTPRAMIASDPLAFSWHDGNRRLQFSYLVANDTGADIIPSQSLSGCPSFIKADVDEASTLTVTGYTSIGITDFIGVYRIEFGADPTSIWTTTLWTHFTSNDTSWTNTTIKHSMTPAAVAADAAVPTHTKIRLTFQAADGEALKIDKAYVGHHAGSGDGWDMAEAVPVLFSGVAAVTIPAGTVLRSDPVTFTYNNTNNLIVSMYCPNDAANTGGGYEAGQTGHQSYSKTGDDAATLDGTGYSSSTAGRQNIVQRVEFGT